MDSNNLKKDIDQIKKNVEEFRKEGLTNPAEIEVKYLEKHPELYEKYVFLTKKIIKGENLEMLDKMLKSIDNINNGADKFKEEVKLGEELSEKYIPSNLKNN